MKIYLLLGVQFLLWISRIQAQKIWLKDHPGKFTRPVAKVINPGAEALFKIFNKTPYLSSPKGFDVNETYHTINKGKIQVTRMDIFMLLYMGTADNPPGKGGPGYNSIQTYLNDLSSLRDPQKVKYSDITEDHGLPEMFTDTFALEYKLINGYPVGCGINTEYSSNSRVFVINPKQRACFKPLTKEQYINFWLIKLQLEIDNYEKVILVESREILRTAAANPSMKNSLEELEKIQNSIVKWIDFLKIKKLHYKQLLMRLSSAEKAEPAFYSINRNIAVMKDKNGNYVDEIKGNLPEELYQGEEYDYLFPLYTYNTGFFETHLPGTALQLIVIHDPYPIESKSEFGLIQQRDFYPNLLYAEMAKLMR